MRILDALKILEDATIHCKTRVRDLLANQIGKLNYHYRKNKGRALKAEVDRLGSPSSEAVVSASEKCEARTVRSNNGPLPSPKLPKVVSGRDQSGSMHAIFRSNIALSSGPKWASMAYERSR